MCIPRLMSFLLGQKFKQFGVKMANGMPTASYSYCFNILLR